jgi:hypothetical protein
LQESIKKIEKQGMTLTGKSDLTSFRSAERKYILKQYIFYLEEIADFSKNLPHDAQLLVAQLSFSDVEKNKRLLSELKKFEDLEISVKPTIKLSKIPIEIRNEVKADLDELDKCFKAACYRSCVILCGRIIEVCLHARYYKETNFDILEKNPGIGLGKLIAKMDEKGIKLDPGLTQQIHLVNNVRIFSVHKKQRTFNPTKEQTEAILLYTLDVVNRLF